MTTTTTKAEALPDPDLEPTVGAERAIRLLGIGRTLGYELLKSGRFPVPVLRLGAQYRIPTMRLLSLLGRPPADAPTGVGDPEPAAPGRPPEPAA